MDIKKLYSDTLKYNCSFVTMKHNNSDLLLVYLGCNNFVVVSNYSGVVAYGRYQFNFGINEAFINYELTSQSFTPSTIEKIIRKHERDIMKLKCKINIERVKQ